LRCRHFLHGKDEPAPGVLDIRWFDVHGNVISDGAWNNGDERVLALRRASRNDDGSVPILSLYLNPTADVVQFRIPPPRLSTRLLIDSGAPDAPERDIAGDEIAVAARSAVLTISVHKAEVS
jgi:glycogen operon protein